MKYKKLKLVTKILAIITICLISFVGIYNQKLNKMENVVKDYAKSKDLTGYREITFDVSNATKVLDESGNVVGNTDSIDDSTIERNKYTKSEEKVNSDDILNEENFDKVQKIFEKRLAGLGVEEYNISVDKQSGKVYLQVPEDEKADNIVSNIKEVGDFQIKDSNDGTVYIDNSHLKSAKVMYNQTKNGTVVFLEIQLNKEGTKILEDLSTNKYATLKESSEDTSSEENTNITENTTEDTNTTEDKNTTEDTNTTEDENTTDETNKSDEESSSEDNKKEQSKIDLMISGSKILSTSFDEPMKDGKIDLTMNSATTDNSKISDYFNSASKVAILLDNGALPISYTLNENKYVTTDISSDIINKVIISLLVIFGILLIYMIIKYKSKGFISAICFIGLVAVYSLILRYTNVQISIESIVAIIIALGLNYVFNINLLKTENDDKKSYNKKYLNMIAKVIPALAISIIFCFTKWSIFVTFGMTMFWGIALILLYNFIVTRNIVNN